MALKTLNKTAYNKLVNILKADDKSQFENLHYFSFPGVGPGEATLYLLTQDGVLGGGSSAGTDLIVGNKKYEIKSVKWKSKAAKDTVYDFKLGGNIQGMTMLESKIQKRFYELKIVSSPGMAEIKESLFKEFKEKHKKEYNLLEKQYQKLAGSYFAGHDVIFIQNDKTSSDFGEILEIKKVKPEDILMERYTSRSIKPLVKIR
jgi:hypothetical protein